MFRVSLLAHHPPFLFLPAHRLPQLFPGEAPPPGAAPTVAGLAPIAAATVPAAAGPPAIAMNTLPSDMADIRGRLVNASQRMNARVDPSWQSYLALPPEIMNPNATVKPEAPRSCGEALQKPSLPIRNTKCSRNAPSSKKPRPAESLPRSAIGQHRARHDPRCRRRRNL